MKLGMGMGVCFPPLGVASPEDPTLLVATAMTHERIDLSWTDNSGDEDGFSIERSPDGVGSWVEIDTNLAGVTTYSDTGLTANTAYYYRVRAFKNAGPTYSGYTNIDNATTYKTWTGEWLERGLAQGIAQGFTFDVSAAAITAVDTFHDAMISQGIARTQIYFVPRVGNNLSTSLVPSTVMGLSGSDIGTAVNFVEGDWTESSGLAGDGSTKYINWPVTPSDLGVTGGLAAYIHVLNNTGGVGIVKGTNSSTGIWSMLHDLDSVNRFYMRHSDTPSDLIFATRNTGWVYGYRTATNRIDLAINDSVVASNATNRSVTPQVRNYFEYANHEGDTGLPSTYSDGTHGCTAWIIDPESWSGADNTALYNAVVALEGAVRP